MAATLPIAFRNADEIFDDLRELCTSPGFVHAIAYFCYQSNTVLYKDEVNSDDVQHLFSYQRVINTEIALLLGLIVQEHIDWNLPSQDTINRYIGKTKSLLESLHRSMQGPNPKDDTPQERYRHTLTEAMFYAGDTPYGYQYIQMFKDKYWRDNKWLQKNWNFSITDALSVTSAIISVMQRNATSTLKKLVKCKPEERSFLNLYKATPIEIANESGLSIEFVENILDAFTFADPNQNRAFNSVHSFNLITATPILKIDRSTVAIFGFDIFSSSLYQSPYYWMMNDNSYRTTAADHRGIFVEDYCFEKLLSVIGHDQTHKRVTLLGKRRNTVGEIDVLCTYGNRLIILQAKAKGLTLRSRSGDIQALKSDFDKSIQRAYDQAMVCASTILDGTSQLVDENNRSIRVPNSIKKIYILCVLSEHYPALTVHVQSSLTLQDHPVISQPLVTDIFLIDTLTEMLNSPLRLFDYIHKRTTLNYTLLAGRERTVLSYYLKHNLHHQQDYSTVFLFDDVSADLDLAMAARREGLPAKSFPDGFLTNFMDNALGRILDGIEQVNDETMIELGFSLLSLDVSGCRWINKKLESLLATARTDGDHHDMTVPVNDSNVGGFTIHCGPPPNGDKEGWLRMHCLLRRYSFRKDRWFGLYLSADNGRPEFVMVLDDEWREDAEIERLAQTHTDTGKLKVLSRKKLGRNERCYCGSGKKYKKCCMFRDQGVLV